MTDTHTPEERLEMKKAARCWIESNYSMPGPDSCVLPQDGIDELHAAFAAGAEWQARAARPPLPAPPEENNNEGTTTSD